MRSLYCWLACLVIAFSVACGPPASPPQGAAASGPNGIPELTKEIIEERINEGWVRDVLPESGTGEPISWSFDADEPKEITIVDRQDQGTRATIVLDIKTQSSPRARNQRYLAGQIRTEWELETGWVLRRWEIERTENISMKYRNLASPTPTGLPGEAKQQR
jgi:hypothetical protein